MAQSYIYCLCVTSADVDATKQSVPVEKALQQCSTQCSGELHGGGGEARVFLWIRICPPIYLRSWWRWEGGQKAEQGAVRNGLIGSGKRLSLAVAAESYPLPSADPTMQVHVDLSQLFS